MSVTIKGLYCGTVQRVSYEVFGHDGNQWLRIHEGDNKEAARDAYHSPTVRKAYQGRVAWCDRIVVETRVLNGASVPTYQLVMQMRGEDGEPGETIRNDYDDMLTALQMRAEAAAMPDCLTAAVVDLSTGRSVDI